MDMTRESKLKNVFATRLLNNINNKVTELKASELSFKHMFNEKEPIVGDNKSIFTHLKTVNCDNYCNSTYMIFSCIYYKIKMVTEHKIIKILTSFFWKTLPVFQNWSLPKSFSDIFWCQCHKGRERYVLLN